MIDIKHFEQHGFIIIRQFFTAQQVDDLTEQVDRIYNIWLANNKSEYIEHRLVNMHSLTSPEYFKQKSEQRIRFFESLTPKKLIDLLDELCDCEIYFHNSQLFFNPYQNNRLPYWHRDMQYSQVDDKVQQRNQSTMLSLHVRTALINETGMEIVSGTHKRWDTELEKNVRLEMSGHKNSEQLPGSVLISLDAGDILIFNAQMIHRGNYELNQSRKALDLCIGKPHTLTSGFLDESVLPTQHEIELIRDSRWYQLAKKVSKLNSV